MIKAKWSSWYDFLDGDSSMHSFDDAERFWRERKVSISYGIQYIPSATGHKVYRIMMYNALDEDLVLFKLTFGENIRAGIDALAK